MHELFKKRRSVREFLDKEVTDEQIKQILTAAMVAPSGRNTRPWEFIVVKDKETREKLGEPRIRGRLVTNAPVTIIVLGKEKESNLWLRDCSLAAGHIYLEATNQGLVTCWINAIGSKTDDGKDAEKVYKELRENKIEVLFDDRDGETSVGEKFNDADLIGCPIRLVVSERSLNNDSIEVKNRDSEDKEMIKIKKILSGGIS